MSRPTVRCLVAVALAATFFTIRSAWWWIEGPPAKPRSAWNIAGAVIEHAIAAGGWVSVALWVREHAARR